MRDYGKVHTTFWSSTTIRGLSEDARALALYLLTCPHGTIAGVFRLPDGYACEDLQWAPERVAEGFRELFAKGFANRCETTKWVWICKHFDWNKPENPNQRKSAAKVALSIPDECAWKPDFMRVSADFLGIDWPENRNPSATVAEPFANQKQEQEQEQEEKLESSDEDSSPESGSAADTGDLLGDSGDVPGARNCPIQRIVALYHRELPMLAQVRELPEQTAKMIRARWRSDPARQSLDWWRDFFRYVARCPFLVGEKTDFQADLLWLVKPTNFAKVINGNYEARAA